MSKDIDSFTLMVAATTEEDATPLATELLICVNEYYNSIEDLPSTSAVDYNDASSSKFPRGKEQYQRWVTEYSSDWQVILIHYNGYNNDASDTIMASCRGTDPVSAFIGMLYDDYIDNINYRYHFAAPFYSAVANQLKQCALAYFESVSVETVGDGTLPADFAAFTLFAEANNFQANPKVAVKYFQSLLTKQPNYLDKCALDISYQTSDQSIINFVKELPSGEIGDLDLNEKEVQFLNDTLFQLSTCLADFFIQRDGASDDIS